MNRLTSVLKGRSSQEEGACLADLCFGVRKMDLISVC